MGLATQIQNLKGRRELWAWADTAVCRRNVFPIRKGSVLFLRPFK